MLPIRQTLRSYVFAVAVLLPILASANVPIVAADAGIGSAPMRFTSDAVDPPYAVIWASQYGTEDYDTALAIAYNPTADAVMVSSHLDGDAGYTAIDTTTGAIQSFDWLTEDEGFSTVTEIVHDEVADELYIAGHIGLDEVFVRKYDPFGAQIFHEKIDSTNGSEHLAPIDSGGFFLAHDLNSVQGAHTLLKYDSGDVPRMEWRIYFGNRPNDDHVNDLAAVGDTAYVIGDAQNFNPRDRDAWLIAFDGNGRQRWVVDFATDGDDFAKAITVGRDGDVFVLGDTKGDIGGVNTGDTDMWLAKYSSTGEERWRRQLGSPDGDYSRDLVYQNGLLYLVGWTDGDWAKVPGEEYHGDGIIVVVYDADGNRQHLQRFSLPRGRHTVPTGLAVDGLGDLYVTGSTNGNWIGEGEEAPGGEDALVLKLSRRAVVEDDEWVLTSEDQAITVNGNVIPSDGVTLAENDQVAVVGTDGEPHDFDIQCRDSSTGNLENVILSVLESGSLFELEALPSNCPQTSTFALPRDHMQRSGIADNRPSDVVGVLVIDLQQGTFSANVQVEDFPLSINTALVWSSARGRNVISLAHAPNIRETRIAVRSGSLSVTPTYQGSKTFRLDSGQSVTIFPDRVGSVMESQSIFLPTVIR